MTSYFFWNYSSTNAVPKITKQKQIKQTKDGWTLMTKYAGILENKNIFLTGNLVFTGKCLQSGTQMLFGISSLIKDSVCLAAGTSWVYRFYFSDIINIFPVCKGPRSCNRRVSINIDMICPILIWLRVFIEPRVWLPVRKGGEFWLVIWKRSAGKDFSVKKIYVTWCVSVTNIFRVFF